MYTLVSQVENVSFFQLRIHRFYSFIAVVLNFQKVLMDNNSVTYVIRDT